MPKGDSKAGQQACRGCSGLRWRRGLPVMSPAAGLVSVAGDIAAIFYSAFTACCGMLLHQCGLHQLGPRWHKGTLLRSNHTGQMLDSMLAGGVVGCTG